MDQCKQIVDMRECDAETIEESVLNAALDGKAFLVTRNFDDGNRWYLIVLADSLQNAIDFAQQASWVHCGAGFYYLRFRNAEEVTGLGRDLTDFLYQVEC